MPFPPVERVKYTKSPLEKVICQVRFPPILSVDTEAPAEFQNLIRNSMPNYEEKIEVQQEIQAGFNAVLPNQIVNPVARVSSNKNHEFKTEDSDWIINITRTFFSISTNKYSTWEEFLEKFTVPLKYFIDIYKPAFFTRVGLRYIDIFCRSKLGLDGYNWNELIQPHLLGLLGSEVSANVTEQNSVSEVLCEDQSSIIRITTKLVKRVDNAEPCFLMDSDVFTTKKIGIEEANEKLEYLHARSSRLVGYAITKTLRDSMEPVKI